MRADVLDAERFARLVADGRRALTDGRYREALEWVDEGLDAGRELDHRGLVFHLRSNQRLAWLFLDELDDDAAAFSEALAVCRDGSCEDVVTRPPNRNRTAVNE